MFKSKKFLIPTICIITFLLSITVTFAAGLSTFFGGRITSQSPCNSDNPTKIVVTISSGRSVGNYVYDMAKTKLYTHSSVRIGSWILGGYNPVIVACDLPTKGTINFIGTSF